MGSRAWIKVYCAPWIQGTLREETPDVRGIWADLLALAGTGQYGDTGEIKLTNGVGYTDEQIAQILCIKKSLWRKAKLRLVETERIKISPRGAISITNWSKYQSEYERQKPYREREVKSSTPEPKIPLTTPLDKEIEKESRKLQPRVTTESYNEKGNDSHQSGNEDTRNTPSMGNRNHPSGKPQATRGLASLADKGAGNEPIPRSAPPLPFRDAPQTKVKVEPVSPTIMRDAMERLAKLTPKEREALNAEAEVT